jgi:hypothetical protein
MTLCFLLYLLRQPMQLDNLFLFVIIVFDASQQLHSLLNVLKIYEFILLQNLFHLRNFKDLLFETGELRFRAIFLQLSFGLFLLDLGFLSLDSVLISETYHYLCSFILVKSSRIVFSGIKMEVLDCARAKEFVLVPISLLHKPIFLLLCELLFQKFLFPLNLSHKRMLFHLLTSHFHLFLHLFNQKLVGLVSEGFSCFVIESINIHKDVLRRLIKLLKILGKDRHVPNIKGAFYLLFFGKFNRQLLLKISVCFSWLASRHSLLIFFFQAAWHSTLVFRKCRLLSH